MKLKYGVIGLGNRAKMLIEAAQITGEVEITAYTYTSETSLKLGKELLPDAKPFDNYKELLKAPELDAVMIATPNHLHTEMVMAALDAGLHVLCEKPLATSIEEIKTMSQKAAQSHKILQVGFENRQSIRFREMKHMLEQQVIGDVKMIWCHEFRRPFRPGWRLDSTLSGGTLLEKNVHHFDLFNWLADSRPVSISAVGSNDTVYQDIDLLDRAWVTIEYENGVQANLGLCMFYHKDEMEFGVMGKMGSMAYSKNHRSITVSTAEKENVIEYNNDMFEGNYHIGEREQQQAFIHAIRTGEQPETDAESAVWSHAVALAAETAIRTGRIMKLQPDGSFKPAQ